ncbi:RNA polymerase sigma factor [Chitinophaga sp. 22321]|uniref:Sigma-70 family RNA polymerase sigma factor n=1 Tax=Chitinophaga hostae TaxID=2831022 RepID=A0ABS5JAL1_9BACT|nr:sigma-70 family RNA polymerase sigma factor [Chitinophaga hostae]MBS0032255.1 sigma-70 family RNA polymerase sigma factor [Chitinophaga hostae]
MLNSEHDMDWSRLKKGDIKALEAIYRAHIKALVRYGLKITDDIDLIRDSIQDLFLEIWKQRHNLADTPQPKFYLFRALRNKLTKVQSKQSFVSESEMQLVFDHLSAEYVELEIMNREGAAQTANTLKQLLENLPQRQREAVFLRFYQNISYERIAEMMNMNYQSVLNLMQRALKALKKDYPRFPSKK